MLVQVSASPNVPIVITDGGVRAINVQLDRWDQRAGLAVFVIVVWPFHLPAAQAARSRHGYGVRRSVRSRRSDGHDGELVLQPVTRVPAIREPELHTVLVQGVVDRDSAVPEGETDSHHPSCHVLAGPFEKLHVPQSLSPHRR